MSNTCENCGNQKVSGVCYNCLRNENDARRFGLPIKKATHNPYLIQRRKKAKPLVDEEQFISEDDWNAQQREKQHQSIKLPRRDQPSAAKRGSSRNQIAADATAGSTASGIDTRHMRRGINRMLPQIYGREILISDILRTSGFKKMTIRQLNTMHIEQFIKTLVAAWRSWWRTELYTTEMAVLVRRFGLDGHAPSTIADLSDELGMAQLHVQVTERNAITRLQSEQRIKRLQQIIIECATKIEQD